MLTVEDHLAQKRMYESGPAWGRSRNSSTGFPFEGRSDEANSFESQFGRMFLKAGADLHAFMSVYIKLAILRTALDRVKLNQFPVNYKMVPLRTSMNS